VFGLLTEGLYKGDTGTCAAGHAVLGGAGATLTAAGVLVVGLGAGDALEGCPLEFIVPTAGVLSLAGGTIGLPPGVIGTTCWLRRSLFGAALAGTVEVVVGTGVVL
jgi:hypothetical protein